MKERIRQMRERLNITQTDLARMLGISNGNVGDWERGRSKPSADALSAIVKNYNVSALWLLTGEGDVFSSSTGGEKEHDPWQLSDYQKEAVEKCLNFLTDEQAALINNYEKLNNRDKVEIRLLIEHKLSVYGMGLSSNSLTSKNGNSGSQTA